jgi:hypothetical protein
MVTPPEPDELEEPVSSSPNDDEHSESDKPSNEEISQINKKSKPKVSFKVPIAKLIQQSEQKYKNARKEFLPPDRPLDLYSDTTFSIKPEKIPLVVETLTKLTTKIDNITKTAKLDPTKVDDYISNIKNDIKTIQDHIMPRRRKVI